LQNAIEQVNTGEGRVSFIVDQRGTLVAHANQHWVQEQRNLGNLPLVQKGLAGQKAFELYYDSDQAAWLLGSVTPMGQDWAVVTTQSALVAARPLLVLATASGLAFGVSFLLFAWIQISSLRQITAPISLLADKADALSHGQYEDLPLERMGRFSEILSLGASFTRMVEAVAERDRLLEQRVADRTRRLQIVATLSERLNAILHPDQLLTEIVNQVQASFGYYHASIFLLDDAGENLVVQAATGEAGAELEAEGFSIRLDADKSLVARAARTGRVVCVDDVQRASDWLPYLSLPDTRSEIAVPIIVQDRVMGVLDVQEDELAAFDASSADMLRSLANQVGVALHNAHLYTEMEKLVAQRTAELIAANQAMAGELQERLRAEEALRDSEQRYRLLFESNPFPMWVYDLETLAFLAVNDAAVRHYGYSRQEFLSMTIKDIRPPEDVPALLENVFHVTSGLDEAGVWRHRKKSGEIIDVEITSHAMGFAGRRAEVILASDITERKRVERVQAAIYRISEATQTAQDLSELSGLIHAIVGELMPAKNFYIALYDASADEFTTPYLVDELEIPSPPYKPGKGLNAYVLRTGKPLLATPEIFEQLAQSGQVELIGRPAVDWLGVPLKTQRGTIGVMAVYTYAEADRLKKADQDILVFVSTQVAMAIERKQAEEQLKASLKEKEVLLKEVHHRVKNNLQVIHSLLNLQVAHVQDPAARKALRESQDRVRTMALVHERLYQSKDLAQIDLGGYVRQLVAGLQYSYQVGADWLDIHTNIHNVFLDVDTAIPCGLVINELVSNSLKHAFPPEVTGDAAIARRIWIEFELRGDQLALTVGDNGIGFPSELDFRSTDSLGLQLVMALVEQLKGDIELERGQGTIFRITFSRPR